jgi:hypothetical protein
MIDETKIMVKNGGGWDRDPWPQLGYIVEVAVSFVLASIMYASDELPRRIDWFKRRMELGLASLLLTCIGRKV